MRDVSCKLVSVSISKNEIGVEKETHIETEIPVKVEDIRANEFYQANEQGFKPSLRLRTSSLNYSGQTELVYMGNAYTIIRTQEPVADEIVLVCERKVKNV